MKRESWYLRNISAMQIGIGDLPTFPTLSPGQRLDLLNYYPKSKIEQSQYLLMAIQKGWFQLTKVTDGVQQVVTADNAASSTTPADQEDVIAATGGLVARTLASLDEVGATGEIGLFEGAFYGFDGSIWLSLMPSWSNLTD